MDLRPPFSFGSWLCENGHERHRNRGADRDWPAAPPKDAASCQRAAVRLKIDRRSAITHSIRVCTDASYWIGRFVITMPIQGSETGCRAFSALVFRGVAVLWASRRAQ